MKLAILDGSPAFERPLHVGLPNLGDRERFLERVHGIFERNSLTNEGPLVRELEAKLAALSGTRHCIATCNGTVALELAVRALELSGEVIVPSFTFVGTAHILQWQNIKPVFCDIDPKTHCLDPHEVERRITPRTAGILGVHLWGHGPNISALAQVAEDRGLPLLFDAAPALGSSHRGRPIGSFGEAAVFSFHATKVANAFEGGAIATDNDALASKLRLMKNFGFAGYDLVTELGINGKMSEISAAMGLTSLESLDDFVARNRDNYRIYEEELNSIRGLRLFEFNDSERHNYQYVVVEVDESEAGLTRDALVSVLHAENVLARRYFYPGCHRMQPYRTLYPEAGRELPRTEEVARRVLVLPTGAAVNRDSIARIGALIEAAIRNADAIRERVALAR